ncbi:tyrosine-type recombinase/integrase, partial [Photobacterium frigidiphilum]
MSATKGMANTMLPLLSVMMQQAEVYGYRAPQSNPCKSFKRYTLVACERYLTPDELRCLWLVLDTHQASSPTAVMILRLLILTGCRGNEVRTVKWRHYRQGHWYLPDSKTGARVVYIGQAAVDVLARHVRRQGGELFPMKKGASVRAVSNLWVKLRIKADIADVRIHDLR